jgi:hypothetical protein
MNLNDIPSWIEIVLSVLALFVTAVGAYGFVVYVRAKGNDGVAMALNDSNKALRDLLADKEKAWADRFGQIEYQQKENILQIGQLQGKVEKLENQNGDMKNLILQSLGNFWKDNPEIAARIQMELSTTGRTN